MAIMNCELEKCCGTCCWFFGECTEGDGCCAKHYWDVPKDGEQDGMLTRCDKEACKDYVSRKEMRHHIAVLYRVSRYLVITNGLRFPLFHDQKGIKDTIDFAVEYIKTFYKL